MLLISQESVQKDISKPVYWCPGDLSSRWFQTKVIVDFILIQSEDSKGRVAKISRSIIFAKFLVKEWAEMEEAELKAPAASFKCSD